MKFDKNIPMEEYIKKVNYELGKLCENRVDNMLKPKLIACNPDELSLTFEFDVQDWELNHFDTMHGGIISTLFDNAFGCLSHCVSKEDMLTTVTLTTNYIKPIPIGSKAIVFAKASSVGKTLINLSGEAYVKGREGIAASATGIYMIIKKPLLEMTLNK